MRIIAQCGTIFAIAKSAGPVLQVRAIFAFTLDKKKGPSRGPERMTNPAGC